MFFKGKFSIFILLVRFLKLLFLLMKRAEGISALLRSFIFVWLYLFQFVSIVTHAHFF